MNNKLKIILSFSALALCTVLIIVQVFAWMALESPTEVGGVSLGIVGIEDADSNISIEVGKPPSDGAANLLPGEYVTAIITITNNAGTSKHYSLNLQRCTVQYPTYTAGFVYDEKYIDVASYYLNDSMYDFTQDELYKTNKDNFFRTFVTPVSDALFFNVSAVEATAFDENYQPLSAFTANGIATEAQLATEVNDYNTLINNVPITDYGLSDGSYTDEEGNTVTISGGEVVIAGGQSATLYMLIYFDPQHTIINANGVELRNSNAFLMQNMWIAISAVSDV